MDEFDSFYPGEEKPLIDAGTYQAKCIKVEKGYYNSVPKFYLTFKVFDFMMFDDPPTLFMAMNSPDGNKVSANTKFYQSWVIANDNKLPRRNDRMSPKIFKNRRFEVLVETVEREFPDGEKMPASLNYSVIRCIKKRLPDEL